jgi:hypothetical protein
MDKVLEISGLGDETFLPDGELIAFIQYHPQMSFLPISRGHAVPACEPDHNDL